MRQSILKLALALMLGASAVQAQNQINITAFGAKAMPNVVNTAAIQKALDKAAEKGGTVVVPAGTFVTGSIFIKSNTTLFLDYGAKLLGSPKIEDYKFLTWGGDKNIDRQPYHLINAIDAENIAIKGYGTIDGNGQAYFQPHDGKFPRWILAIPTKVSPMVELKNCKDVTIEGITLTNPAGWTLHLHDVRKAYIENIRIRNNLFTPNSDGIDLTGCEDVRIQGCDIETCDDAICLKTSPDSRETKRIAVTNCTIKTMCVGLKLGNESYKDMSQVTFSNCVVYGSSRLVGIYSQNGAVISDVTVSNIVGDTKAPFIFNRPVHISLLQPDTGTKRGAIRNILISNLSCETEGRILVTAPDGEYIENLTLRDIVLTYPIIEDPRPYVAGARSKQFSPKNIEARGALAAVVAENVRNLVLDNLQINWPKANVKPDAGWLWPERIEHGGSRVFVSDFSTVKQTELSAFYGRGIVGGYIDIPLAESSAPGIKRAELRDCNIRLRE